MLATNRFANIYRFDWTEVDATSEVVIGLSHLAKLASEHSERALAEVLASVDAELAEFASRDFADTPELLDVERFDEIEGFVGMDDVETIGFAIVGCHFGEEFVVRDTSRGNEVEFGANALFDFAGNIDSEFDARLVVGDVEKRLVE